ncbi:MAG: hypothetical protein FJ291_13355 [Planctomycetes bacterium]|nr:hypothetical protein [Planctomycetota bacterium]
MSEMDPQAWEAVRGELAATGLVRVESEIQLSDRPFLRFHPTLGYAAARLGVPDPEAAAGRQREAAWALFTQGHFNESVARLEALIGRLRTTTDFDPAFQLAQIHLLLGELDEAEEHAHQSREIRERLGLKEAYIDYNTLAEIARARGDEAQAAGWERKRDEARAELRRRATAGGRPSGFRRSWGRQSWLSPSPARRRA